MVSALQFRPAGYTDTDGIIRIDDVGRAERQRVNYIHKSVTSRNCHVAVEQGQVVGYAVLEYSFFDYGFVSLMHVDPDARRRGVGTGLLGHMEQVCRTDRLFVTADEANVALQSLVEKLGYARSGIVENIAEDGPVLIYVKMAEPVKPRFSR